MKIRVDQLLVDRALAESRERAQRLIRAGLVIVGEQRVDKPGQRVDADAPVRLKGEPCPYVSRGGLKLAGALRRFGLTDLRGRIAVDVGASTGGFTDCLLQHGAATVWAIDTGRGQLHARLREDPRVRLLERCNARYLAPDWLDEQRVDLIAIDVSFISLRLILPPLPPLLAPAGSVVALIKPQFEAGPADVGRGGVVRERRVHRRVLADVLNFAAQTGWSAVGLCPSPLRGPAGNLEFFAHLRRRAGGDPSATLAENAIERVLDEAYTQEATPRAAEPGA